MLNFLLSTDREEHLEIFSAICVMPGNVQFPASLIFQ